MKVKGRVSFQDLGAGAWVLEAEDGKRYELLGVERQRLIAGTRVEIEGDLDADAVSTSMAGPSLRVIRWTPR
jgi:Protein of unknown function (DUF5818)